MSSNRERFFKQLERIKAEHKVPDRVLTNLEQFITQFEVACGGHLPDHQWALFESFTDRVIEQVISPYQFEPYHQKVREPFDYYALGMALWRPLVQWEQSRVLGQEHLETLQKQLAQGDNVIFLANHQAEADPQFIGMVIEPIAPKLAEELIFVAGHRVTTDPVAVPFSLGCDLLCIYSRRHVNHPPELREQKQRHNQKAIAVLGQLLASGGKAVYVAPAGGRDRPNGRGIVEVAAFDPDAIAMMELVAHKAKRPTHFYPLALSTYRLLPPPPTVEKELGEERRTQRGPIGVAFGEALPLSKIGEGLPRPERRELVAKTAHTAVATLYKQLQAAMK